MTINEKLKKIGIEEESSWIDEAEQDLRQARVRKKSWKVALRVLALLGEKGITQTELANRMNVSRQQVTKIVKGKENLTLETIDKLEHALGEVLLDVPLVPVSKAEPVDSLELPIAGICSGTVPQEGTDWRWSSWAKQLNSIRISYGGPTVLPDYFTIPHHCNLPVNDIYDLITNTLTRIEHSKALMRTIEDTAIEIVPIPERRAEESLCKMS
ncbi:MAG TPA: helix-turn-helix transcriptional regulator [Puia sp.]|nr:helix-turn-helix transcriptional regulator [Puia sp.]